MSTPNAEVAAAMAEISETLAGLLDEGEWSAVEPKIATVCAELEKAAGVERNREMWRGQCERQAERLTALHIAINDHNQDCASQCESRKALGPSHCPMNGYDRECGDCPRDGMLIIAPA